MIYKLKLKNSEETVLLDADVYNHLSTHAYYSRIKLLENLRKHSSGCAVFQKTWKKAEGGYKTETIYLHKLVAETFLSDDKTSTNSLVGAVNGNKLDCRLENIIWRSRAWASRQRKTTSQSGYMGVYRENNRFRAVISAHGKSIHIGMYDTAEEAALAYNKRSRELFGEKGKQNRIGSAKN